MDSKGRAAMVLTECGSKLLPGVYVVGAFSRGVSFVTQQNRALNLVWALFESGTLSPGQSVAVIGGGLAGLTASAGLLSRGSKVVLCETERRLMTLQMKSKLRYVHPYAHLWPSRLATRDQTDLPFLNWNANTADRVRLQILDQWQSFETRVIPRIGYRVRSVTSDGVKPILTYNQPRFEREKEELHAVVVAVGFGLEKGRSYWEPDGHEYPRTGPRRKVVAVSGCGDGGIVDVLRLRVDDFDYASAITTLLGDPGADAIARVTRKAEAELADFINDNQRANQLESEYRSIAEHLSKDVQKSLIVGLRDDTKVHLISPSQSPYSTPAMPINRILLAVLLNKDSMAGLEYHAGRCAPENISKNGDISVVRLTDTTTREEPIECEDVLFRHGPTPIIDDVLPGDFVKALRDQHATRLRSTAMALRSFWPPDYFPKTPVSRLVQPVPKGKLANSPTRSGYPLSILYCGSPIGPTQPFGGTLGCFVTTQDSTVGFLSTAHVLAAGGRAALGEHILAPVEGDRMVGVLHSYIAIKRGHSALNLVDAGIAKLAEGIEYYPGFHPSLKLPVLRPPRDARRGERVFKVGATSGLTFGVVTDISMDILINIDEDMGTFRDTIRIEAEGSEPFMRSGDSGALIVALTGEPIGLLFAGDMNGSYGVACSLGLSCSLLACRMVLPT